MRKNRQDNGWFTDLPEPAFFDDADDTFSSPFANIVSVTFSAFDDFPVVPRAKNALKRVQYTNIGLRKVSIVDVKGTRKHDVVVRQPDDLSQDFIDSAKLCALDDRKDRLIAALKTLESDPVFAESGVAALPDSPDKGFGVRAGKLFRRLSSGHKIVLLTVHETGKRRWTNARLFWSTSLKAIYTPRSSRRSSARCRTS